MYEDRGDGMFWLWVVIITMVVLLFAGWYGSNCEVVETYDFHAVITDLDSRLYYNHASKLTTRKYYLTWVDGYETGRERISASEYRKLQIGDMVHVYATIQETPFGEMKYYEIRD